MAYNIEYHEVSETSILKAKTEKLAQIGKPEGKVIGGKSNYAYLFEWNEYYAPNALNELLSEELIVKVGTQKLEIPTSEVLRKFNYGTIQVPVWNNQTRNADDI